MEYTSDRKQINITLSIHLSKSNIMWKIAHRETREILRFV